MKKNIKFLLVLIIFILSELGILVSTFTLLFQNFNYINQNEQQETTIDHKFKSLSAPIANGVTEEKFFLVDPEEKTLVGLTNSAWYESTLVIPSGIESIKDSVFARCINLETIVIPDSVINMGVDVFSNCTKLRNVTLSKNLKIINNWDFFMCDHLQNINIPEGVVEIRTSAFERCTLLHNMKLPNTIKNIGASAFNYCENLNKITFPKSLSNLDEDAFSNCCKLNTVTFLGDAYIQRKAFGNNSKNIHYFVNYKSTKLSLIRNDIANLNQIALANKDCYIDSNNSLVRILDDSLTKSSIVIPFNTTNILDDNVFEKCLNLKELDILSYDLNISSSWLKNLPKDTRYIIYDKRIKSNLIDNGIPESQIIDKSDMKPIEPYQDTPSNLSTGSFIGIILGSTFLGVILIALAIGLPIHYRNKKISNEVYETRKDIRTLTTVIGRVFYKLSDNNVKNQRLLLTKISGPNYKNIVRPKLKKPVNNLQKKNSTNKILTKPINSTRPIKTLSPTKPSSNI